MRRGFGNKTCCCKFLKLEIDCRICRCSTSTDAAFLSRCFFSSQRRYVFRSAFIWSNLQASYLARPLPHSFDIVIEFLQMTLRIVTNGINPSSESLDLCQFCDTNLRHSSYAPPSQIDGILSPSTLVPACISSITGHEMDCLRTSTDTIWYYGPFRGTYFSPTNVRLVGWVLPSPLATGTRARWVWRRHPLHPPPSLPALRGVKVNARSCPRRCAVGRGSES